MDILNIEIKAKCKDLNIMRTKLKELNADFKGEDRQIDTYFNCPYGRLKLRSGNIENSLIFYSRDNILGPKESDVALSEVGKDHQIKEVLTKAYGVMSEVDKKREIYFIDNVKFHLDEVKGLGTFVEVEAIDHSGVVSKDILLSQCQKYIELLGIREDDLMGKSYSDLLMIES